MSGDKEGFKSPEEAAAAKSFENQDNKEEESGELADMDAAVGYAISGVKNLEKHLAKHPGNEMFLEQKEKAERVISSLDAIKREEPKTLVDVLATFDRIITNRNQEIEKLQGLVENGTATDSDKERLEFDKQEAQEMDDAMFTYVQFLDSDLSDDQKKLYEKLGQSL